MNDRHFHLRLSCTYQDNENKVDELAVEVLADNQWEPLDLGIRSPGFLTFIYGLFSCQHLYMRTNSAERNLILTSATGELKVDTDEDWRIKDAMVTFKVKLKSGTPTEDDINYITGRMTHCPVSTNISKQINVRNSIEFAE